TRTDSHPRSLHDALPISPDQGSRLVTSRVPSTGPAPDPPFPRRPPTPPRPPGRRRPPRSATLPNSARPPPPSRTAASVASKTRRSEEHTSELQSRENLVC